MRDLLDNIINNLTSYAYRFAEYTLISTCVKETKKDIDLLIDNSFIPNVLLSSTVIICFDINRKIKYLFNNFKDLINDPDIEQANNEQESFFIQRNLIQIMNDITEYIMVSYPKKLLRTIIHQECEKILPNFMVSFVEALINFELRDTIKQFYASAFDLILTNNHVIDLNQAIYKKFLPVIISTDILINLDCQNILKILLNEPLMEFSTSLFKDSSQINNFVSPLVTKSTIIDYTLYPLDYNLIYNNQLVYHNHNDLEIDFNVISYDSQTYLSLLEFDYNIYNYQLECD